MIVPALLINGLVGARRQAAPLDSAAGQPEWQPASDHDRSETGSG